MIHFKGLALRLLLQTFDFRFTCLLSIVYYSLGIFCKKCARKAKLPAQSQIAHWWLRKVSITGAHILKVNIAVDHVNLIVECQNRNRDQCLINCAALLRRTPSLHTAGRSAYA